MMKKRWLVLLVVFFLIGVPQVKAITGDLAYDITSAEVKGNSIRIAGWMLINDEYGQPTHNIQPQFTLEVLGVSEDTKTVINRTTPITNNEAERPPYSAPCADPHDYTKAYYTKAGSFTYPDPDKCGARAAAIRDNKETNPKFAININFIFTIPFATISEAAKEPAKKVIFKLTSKLEGREETVYGVKFNDTKNVTKDVNIAIHKDRMDITAKENLLKEKGFELHNMIDRVINVSTYGQGRPDPSLDTDKYWYYDGSKPISLTRSQGQQLNPNGTRKYSPIYYYNAKEHSDNSATYTIDLKNNNAEPLTILAAAKDTIYTYKVKVKVGGDCFINGKCFLDDQKSTIESWLPSFWTRTVPGDYTWIERPPTTTQCETRPDCQLNKLGSGTTCPGKGETGDCCRLCENAAYKGTYFCIQKCPGDGPPPECDDPDAEKRYCCKYKNDPMCKPPIGEETTFPETNPSDNKNGTCDTSMDTRFKFKYPKAGWGRIQLTNNACTISCQEALITTFRPDVSVRAGMGFTYPINMESSRYCTAAYDNEGWQAKVAAAATAANTAYNNMVKALNEAKRLDDICGTMDTPTAAVKPCSCGSRSGLSCLHCTCSGCSSSKCGSSPCGTIEKPRTCCNTCSWECTKSTSCPSIEGYSSSYKSSIDRCYVNVCKKSRKLWTTAQSEIRNYTNQAATYRSQYNSYVNTINQLINERNTCNNYVANNKYNGASGTGTSVNVPNQSKYTITSNSRKEDTAYENARYSKATTYQIYQCFNRPHYPSVSLVGDLKATANSFAGTYCEFKTVSQTYSDFWNKKSDSKIKFEFSQEYYVQRYTGALRTSSASGYDYHGRYSYTDYFAKSGINNFRVILTNIGPNIPGVSNNLWSINPFNCRYDIDNLIFPPEGDPNNYLYGNVTFMYRSISLIDPFPGRSPGENWDEFTSLITSKNYKIYNEKPLYEIGLKPHIMQNIRSYGLNYTSFNATDPYISTIVRDLIKDKTIIKNK